MRDWTQGIRRIKDVKMLLISHAYKRMAEEQDRAWMKYINEDSMTGPCGIHLSLPCEPLAEALSRMHEQNEIERSYQMEKSPSSAFWCGGLTIFPTDECEPIPMSVESQGLPSE